MEIDSDFNNIFDQFMLHIDVLQKPLRHWLKCL
jgi:hypothetical protein